jgi:predicted GIY-YIG superfamily endonuclease
MGTHQSRPGERGLLAKLNSNVTTSHKLCLQLDKAVVEAAPDKQKWWVYVLGVNSHQNSKLKPGIANTGLYIGRTGNLQRRLQEHRSGTAGLCGHNKVPTYEQQPVWLIAALELPTKDVSIAYEGYLHKLVAAKPKDAGKPKANAKPKPKANAKPKAKANDPANDADEEMTAEETYFSGLVMTEKEKLIKAKAAEWLRGHPCKAVALELLRDRVVKFNFAGRERDMKASDAKKNFKVAKFYPYYAARMIQYSFQTGYWRRYINIKKCREKIFALMAERHVASIFRVWVALSKWRSLALKLYSRTQLSKKVQGNVLLAVMDTPKNLDPSSVLWSRAWFEDKIASMLQVFELDRPTRTVGTQCSLAP